MANQIPERLINYRAYKDGNFIIGTADITLPSIEAITDTISGAGIAGELETPVLGHFKSMTTTIKWRTVTNGAIDLTAQQSHQVDFRGSMQNYDAGEGKSKTVPIRVSTTLIPKKTSLGNMQVAKTMDSENEMEVIYINLYIDGDSVLEIDKLNFKCVINGQDFLQSVRDDIGM